MFKQRKKYENNLQFYCFILLKFYIEKKKIKFIFGKYFSCLIINVNFHHQKGRIAILEDSLFQTRDNALQGVHTRSRWTPGITPICKILMDILRTGLAVASTGRVHGGLDAKDASPTRCK